MQHLPGGNSLNLLSNLLIICTWNCYSAWQLPPSNIGNDTRSSTTNFNFPHWIFRGVILNIKSLRYAFLRILSLSELKSKWLNRKFNMTSLKFLLTQNYIFISEYVEIKNQIALRKYHVFTVRVTYEYFYTNFWNSIQKVYES